MTTRPCWDSLGRPAGHADTPLDDQQAMLILPCMLLLDKSLCTPDAQCNVKMCALEESLNENMYHTMSPGFEQSHSQSAGWLDG